MEKSKRIMLSISAVLLVGGFGLNRYGARQQRIHGWDAHYQIYQYNLEKTRATVKNSYTRMKGKEYGKGWYITGYIAITAGAGLMTFVLINKKAK